MTDDRLTPDSLTDLDDMYPRRIKPDALAPLDDLLRPDDIEGSGELGDGTF